VSTSTTYPIYVIAIGSNQRGRHGPPRAEVRAAIAALPGVIRVSRLIETVPVGPSIRRFVNAAVLIESAESPPAMLDRLKAIERAFGRRRGQRWGARVIDLDIILWSGGVWRDSRLCVPHAAFRARDFVLAPLAEIAPRWRDPETGLTPRHLAKRLHKVDRARVRS
jgi:2-amino-4-hydroxy-6-hydroxymethyldihydropteridine diphosphokinase